MATTVLLGTSRMEVSLGGHSSSYPKKWGFLSQKHLNCKHKHEKPSVSPTWGIGFGRRLSQSQPWLVPTPFCPPWNCYPTPSCCPSHATQHVLELQGQQGIALRHQQDSTGLSPGTASSQGVETCLMACLRHPRPADSNAVTVAALTIGHSELDYPFICGYYEQEPSQAEEAFLWMPGRKPSQISLALSASQMSPAGCSLDIEGRIQMDFGLIQMDLVLLWRSICLKVFKEAFAQMP